MMNVLLACSGLAVNALYALAALAAAGRYGIPLRLLGGIGLTVLVAGTSAECAVLFAAHGAVAWITILAAFGAVVTGAACDAACGFVFDAVTFPCLAVMVVVSLANHTFQDVVGGSLAAGGSLYALHAVTRGRGLGLGDVKMACCIGAYAGAIAGVEALGIAFVLGGAYAACLLIAKRAGFGAELRFAPYLAAGMTIVALRGIAP